MLWIGCAVMLALLWTLILTVGAGRAELNRRHGLALAQSTAKGFSEYVALNLSIADHTLLHARDHYARTGALPPFAMLTAELGTSSRMLLQVSVADAQGRMVASSLSLQPGLSIADREHFKAFVSDERDRLHVSPPVVGRVSKKMSLQLVRPLLGPAGEFRGVIVCSIDPLMLQDYFGALAAFADDGTVVIVGRGDGLVRVRFSRDGISWGHSLADTQAMSILSGSKAGHFEVKSTIDQKERLVGFHRVEGYPLVVGVTSKRNRWPVTEMALTVAFGIAFSIMLVLYTRGRIRRIDEQDALIAQLTRSREREAEASRMKSRFIASVSHELRTPLNAILGFSELLRDIPDHPENTNRADLIHRSGQHLLALLNTLLDMAKIEAGRMEVRRAEVDLVNVVRTQVEMQRASATKKGLTMAFESRLPASQSALADTDETKFVQVINNLLNNAVKFTGKGGVCVEVCMDAGTFVVRIEDTGRGIPAEQLAHIFDRFSGASAPGTAREAGTGLGLSLSRELIRLLGGRIDISSRIDQGTQVTICLPGARLREIHP